MFQEKLEPNNRAFYNFTSNYVPPNILTLLSKGSKYIPLDDCSQAMLLFKQELFNIIKWYYSMHTGTSLTGNYKDMSLILSNLAAICPSPHSKFYNDIFNQLQNLKVCDCKPDESMTKKLFPNATLLANDKNRGFSLISNNMLLKGELSNLSDLQATQVFLHKQEILNNLNNKINLLIYNLPYQQVLILKQFPLMTKQLQHVPILKVKPKIHKLNQKQLNELNIKELKYRPIVSGQFCVTKPVSKCVLKLIRELNQLVINSFPKLHYKYIDSGIEIAHQLDQLPIHTTKYHLFYSCDIENAYTNISIHNLNTSLMFLFDVLQNVNQPFPRHKFTLLVSLVNFVLNISYLSISNETYWKLGSFLPMGCCFSGDALDSVCLPGEIVKFGLEEKCLSNLYYVPSFLTQVNKFNTL